MRANHVICIDFQLRLGQKLTVTVQEQRLTDLIAIGLLSIFLDQNFALKHANSTIAQHFFEHLSTFATQCIMSDENCVIVVKITVTDCRTGHMGHGVITGQFNHALVACQQTVRPQRKRFEYTFCPQAGEQMRHQATAMIRTLRPYVMKLAAIGNVDFKNMIKTRCRSAAFKQFELCVLCHFDDVMQRHIRACVFVAVNHAQWFTWRGFDIDQNAIAGLRGIESGQRPGNRGLPRRLKAAINRFRPVDVKLCCRRQPLYCDPVKT